MIWVLVTLAAAAFQVARNGLQRSLMAEAGPWGATLVRFLFALPFSALLVAGAVLITPGARPHAGPAFWTAALGGGLSQVLATATFLTAMRRGGFAVATAMQQSSLPLAAILGFFVFHDILGPVAWVGVAVSSVGLFALSLPRHATGPQPISGAGFGLLSGLLFGLSLNAFRQAGHTLEPRHPVYAAIVSVLVVQAVQAAALGAVLAIVDRAALAAVFRGWRRSLGAGLFGALASSGWFTAVALAPAGPVRAVGTVEAPLAALAGGRFFGERLAAWKWAAGFVALVGVVMTSLG